MTAICPRCQSQINEEDIKCASCQFDLSQTLECEICGTELLAYDQPCPECGYDQTAVQRHLANSRLHSLRLPSVPVPSEPIDEEEGDAEAREQEVGISADELEDIEADIHVDDEEDSAVEEDEFIDDLAPPDPLTTAAMVIESESDATSRFEPDSLTEWLEEIAGQDIPDTPVLEQVSDGLGPVATPELPEWLPDIEDGIPVDDPEKEDQVDDIDWLDEAVDLKDVLTQEVDAADIALAEIPEWLAQLKPVAADPSQTSPISPTEGTLIQDGPLAGLRDPLPKLDAVYISLVDRPLPQFVITEQQQTRVRLLNRIVRRPQHPRPYRKPAPHSLESNWWRTLPFLIFLAILVPILLSATGYSVFEYPEHQATAENVAVFNTIQALPDSSTTLIAYDFSFGASREMLTVADPIITHLMERNSKLIVISTEPAGPELAQQHLEGLAQRHRYTYGEQYINLGYIPGSSVALRAFVTEPWVTVDGADHKGIEQAESEGRSTLARENPASSQLSESLGDLDLILILAAQRSDLINWLEQAGPASGVNLPMIAGVSAAIGPLALPYTADSAQLDGYIGGVVDASVYPEQSETSSVDDHMQPGIAMLLILIAGTWIIMQFRSIRRVKSDE